MPRRPEPTRHPPVTRTPGRRARPLGDILSGHKPHTKRSWRPADTRKLARVVNKLTSQQLRARHEQIITLARIQAPHAIEALRLVYLAMSWLDRRVVLEHFAPHITPKHFAMLVEVGRDGDPFTRLMLVDLFEKFGYMAAEPFLIRMLDEPDTHLRQRAAQALGELGTRRSIESLLGLYGDSDVAPDARAAVDAITARYPASRYPDPGSLSLADENTIVGALSAIDAPEGALQRYAHAEITMREASPSKASLETNVLGWHRLPSAPRPIPSFAWHQTLCWGAHGQSQLGWLLLLVASVTWGFQVTLIGDIMLGPIVFGLGLFALIAGVVGSRDTLMLLRYGYASFLTLGRHMHHTEDSLERMGHKPSHPSHEYELEYIDAQGHDQMLVRWHPLEKKLWNKHLLQPMLCLKTEARMIARPIDEIAHTFAPGPHGTWKAHPMNIAIISVLPALTLLITLLRAVL